MCARVATGMDRTDSWTCSGSAAEQLRYAAPCRYIYMYMYMYMYMYTYMYMYMYM